MLYIPQNLLNQFIGTLNANYKSVLNTINQEFKSYGSKKELFELSSQEIRNILNNPQNQTFSDSCIKAQGNQTTRCAVFRRYFTFLVLYERKGAYNLTLDVFHEIWKIVKKGRYNSIEELYDKIDNAISPNANTSSGTNNTSTSNSRNNNTTTPQAEDDESADIPADTGDSLVDSNATEGGGEIDPNEGNSDENNSDNAQEPTEPKSEESSNPSIDGYKINNLPRQMVIYGAPGNGKSHSLQEFLELKDEKVIPRENIHRITFHPEMDYASFVGAYIPTMNGKDIVYEFQPQAFLDAFVQAVKDTSKPVVLIIEEINRGNCAEIFGDIFQLLDRNATHTSDYAITVNKHMAKYLEGKFRVGNKFVEVKGDQVKIKLPSNMFIWATMNVSDQSLFPIDSAFFRRWNMRYMPVGEAPKDVYIEGIEYNIDDKRYKYTWHELHKKINELMDAHHIPDKKLGARFVKWKEDDKGNPVVSLDDIVNKVIFYLYKYVFSVYSIEEDLMEKCPFDSFFDSKTFKLDPNDNNNAIKNNKVKKFLNKFLDKNTIPEIEDVDSQSGDNQQSGQVVPTEGSEGNAEGSNSFPKPNSTDN